MPDQNQIKEWYDKRHAELGDEAWRPPHAYPVFLDYLGVEPGKKFLDIACGTGYLLKAAGDRGLETFGIDLSEEGVKVARQNAPKATINQGNGEDLKFPDNTFDYVSNLGALEHFLDIEKGINEMVRVAKPGGKFCIVVPNINYIQWKFKKDKGTKQQDINENLFSLKQWSEQFRRGGLEILKVHQDKWHISQIKVFQDASPVGIIKRFVYKLVWMFLPLGMTYQFIFIMRKK